MSEADALRDQAEIRREMVNLRLQIYDDTHQAVGHARAMTDWRYYVRQFPWITTAVASGLGFLLMPKSRRETIATMPVTFSSTSKPSGWKGRVANLLSGGGGMTGRLAHTLATLAVNKVLPSILDKWNRRTAPPSRENGRHDETIRS